MTNFIALCIAILLYTMGFFAFFEMLGIKREVEILLLIPITMYALPCLRVKQVYKNAIIWLIVLFILMEVLIGHNLLRVLDLTAAFLVCSIIIARKYIIKRVIMFVIIITSIFAIMSISQYIFYKIDPSLGYNDFSVRDDARSEEIGTETKIGWRNAYNPVNLLGSVIFNSPDEVGRPYSFAYEPSITMLYFMLPAVVALTYSGINTILPVLVILFSILCSSGTTLLCISMFLPLYIMFLLNKRIVKYFIALPYLMVPMLFILVTVAGLDRLLAIFNYLSNYSAIFSKETSLTVRALDFIGYAIKLLTHPFGFPEKLTSNVGAFLASGIRGGWIAMILFVYISFKLNRKILSISVRRRELATVMLLLFSIFSTIILMADYGFFHFFGFVLLTMIKIRIDELSTCVA